MRFPRASLLLLVLLAGTVLGLLQLSSREERPPPRQSPGGLAESVTRGGAGELPEDERHDLIASVEVAPVSDAAEQTVQLPASDVSRRDARAIVASAWATETLPEHVEFREWTGRFLATDEVAAREALVAEGVRLAEARRAALKQLIVSDPEAALAAAVPLRIRRVLPAAVVARLEQRVSARGELALNAITPAPGGAALAEPVFRSALIDGVEYRAHVYGRRAEQTTLLDAALHGVAVDRELAVAESPVRILEPDEIPDFSAATVTTCADCAAAWGVDPSPERISYEYAGLFGSAADERHFREDASRLEAAERDLTEADGQPGTYSVVGRPTRAWTHGPKKVLIIRVDFSDLPGAPVSDGETVTEEFAARCFSDEGGVRDFYVASSFGKTWPELRPAVGGDSPDVTPVLRLPRPALSYAVNGDNASLHFDARAAATKAGFDPAAYDRVGVVFSHLGNLKQTEANGTVRESQITYGGLATVIGPNFWVNGAYSFRVVAHELGHTYGLRHANLWKVSDGDPVSETGESIEYGDPFDIMGGGEGEFSSTDDFSHWGKSLLQWIPDSAVAVAVADGVHRIHRFDAAGADLSLTRALKIPRDPTFDYWIGYRRGTDHASLDNGLYVLRGFNTNRPAELLDFVTPGVDPKDAALPLGTSFEDVAAGIEFTPIAQGGSGADEWIDVQVVVRPRVQWVATRVFASEQGGLATLTLRRTGSAAGAVSVSYTSEDDTATAPHDYLPLSGIVSWDDGDMADKTISVTLVADDDAEPAETFRVRIDAVTGGARVGPSTAVVTIAEAGARDDTFAADLIGATVYRVLPLPDGSILAGGAFGLLQDSAFATFTNVGRVARFREDGALDKEFDFSRGADDGTVFALALQADGRILVGGSFRSYAGASAGGVVRIFPDGSLDPSFKPGAGANGTVYDIVVQPDGRILVAGAFTKFAGVARKNIVRLEPDGRIDTGFANPTFASPSSIRSIALQSDGKVVVGGAISYSGLSGEGFKSGVARLNANGSRDTGFDVGFGAHTAEKTNKLTTVFRVGVQPDGRIIAVGDFTGFGGFKGSPRRHIARLSPSGAVDTAFAPRPSLTSQPASTSVVALRILPGNRLLVGGAFTKVGSVECQHLALINEDGSVDTSFAQAGGHSGNVTDFALLPDGKVLFAGDPTTFQSSAAHRALWRLIPGLSGAPGKISFSSDAYSGREGGSVVLTVQRIDGSLGPARVAYAVARGLSSDTATAGADYTLAAGTLSWNDGDDTARTITIPLHQDQHDDDGEVFTVRLGEPVLGGASLGTRRETLVTIEPLDPRAQTITFPPLDDVAIGEGDVSLLATSSSGRSVGFELVSGAAILNGSTLTPTAVGPITVRAMQPGDADFDPAPPVERTFTAFVRADITLTQLAQSYTGTPRPVGFTSTPPDIAVSIDYAGSSTPPAKVGSYPVTLEVIEPFVRGSAAGTLTISKATLVVKAQDQRRLAGTPNTPVALVYEGFQGDETTADLKKTPVAKIGATKASKPGEYAIKLSGGASDSYAFELIPGVVRVIGFGGTYETLLAAPGEGNGPLGKLRVTIPPAAPTFTGVLDLGEEPKSISFKGKLQLDPPPEESGQDSATGTWASTAAAPRDYRVVLTVTDSACAASVYRGDALIAEGVGPRIFVPPAKTAVSWIGAYTAWLDDFAPTTPDDARPLPPGVGHASWNVPRTGAFTWNVKLPDAAKFSTPLKPDASGGYRFFARPYGKRANAFVAGRLDLGDTNAGRVFWQKDARGADANLRGGFALEGRVTAAGWHAPNKQTPLRTILGLSPETGVFSAIYTLDAEVDADVADFSEVPEILTLSAAGKVVLGPAKTPNPTKFELKPTPKNGAFSGSFVVPKKRKISFSGSLRPMPDDASGEDPVEIGRGFFVVPAATKGKESTLGEIRLIAPPSGPAP